MIGSSLYGWFSRQGMLLLMLAVWNQLVSPPPVLSLLLLQVQQGRLVL